MLIMIWLAVRARLENICWENALKTIKGIDPVASAISCTNWPMRDTVALVVPIPSTSFLEGGSTRGD